MVSYILIMAKLVATLVTNNALDDLAIFLKTLMLWNEVPPTIFLFADTAVAQAVPSFKYTGEIRTKVVLDKYANKTRAEMEATRGSVRPNMWFDLMCEKLDLLDWVFSEQGATGPRRVFLFDADICFFGPLPEVPSTASVMLSQHMIRPRDEARFGKYNAGYLWIGAPEAVAAWRAACDTSHFFEQAALECFDGPEWAGRVAHFGIQHNYGWWRLLQGAEDPAALQKKWSIFRDKANAGIRVDGAALGSVHTHWHEKRDMATATFNQFVKGFLERLAPSHPKAKQLHRILSGPL
jgi:hypothetical protein